MAILLAYKNRPKTIGGSAGRTNDYLKFDGVASYGRLQTAVTVDRIVMFVVPSTDNSGLPTGAPAVTAGVGQTIDFAYSGSIQEFGRNGAVYFDGIIGDVEGYLNGEVVLNISLDQKGSDTQPNRADAANNITLFNVDHGVDWFENVDGQLLGYERVVNGDFSDGLNGWVVREGVTAGVVDGRAVITVDGTDKGVISDYEISVTDGQTFLLSLDYDKSLSGFERMYVGLGPAPWADLLYFISDAAMGVGADSYIASATSSGGSYLNIRSAYVDASPGWFSVDNVSLRQYLGDIA